MPDTKNQTPSRILDSLNPSSRTGIQTRIVNDNTRLFSSSTRCKLFSKKSLSVYAGCCYTITVGVSCHSMLVLYRFNGESSPANTKHFFCSSSMSTGLNSMTGVIFEDLIKPNIKKPLSESQASFLMKVIVVIIGTICVTLVFVVEQIGSTLIQTSKSLGAITAGPLLGMFTLGMFFPSANPTGALIGGITSGCLVTWISIGTHFKLKQGYIKFPTKTVSIQGCNANWLEEYIHRTTPSKMTYFFKGAEDIFAPYKMSYMYYTGLGTVTAIVVGLIVSYISGNNQGKTINRDLISPVVHKLYKLDKTVKENDIKLSNKNVIQ